MPISVNRPSWFDLYVVNGQKFEIEIFPKMLVIWSIYSYFPDVIELNKPYTFYKRFFSPSLFRFVGDNSYEKENHNS